MSDLIGSASDWLADQFEEHSSVLVTYQVGVDSITDVPATKGRSVRDVHDEHSINLIEESDDWFIQVDRLVIDASPVEPKKGHRIIETIGTKSLTYEVIGDRNSPSYKLIGNNRKVFRIYTKLIKEE